MGLKPQASTMPKDKKVISATAARISQETFDDAVRENMSELDMEEDEALADAISQFEAQGIDLSNILKQPPSAERDAHPVLRGVAALLDATRAGAEETRELRFGEGSSQSTMRLTFKALAVNELGSDEHEGLEEALEALGAACAKEGDEGIRNRALLASRDGIEALSSACLSLIHRKELASALRALSAGMQGSPENRDLLGLRGLLALNACVLERREDARVQAAAFDAAAAAMIGHEANRASLHEKCLFVSSLAFALDKHRDERPTVVAACAALRALTLQDDGRVAVNKGFDRARAASELGCLPLIVAQLHRAAGLAKATAQPAAAGPASDAVDLQLACIMLNTLSRLTASAKICETLVDIGALDTSVHLLRSQVNQADACRAASGLLAALAGDDGVKSRLGSDQVPELAAAVLLGHSDNVSALDACAQLLAALTTRHTGNCAAFVGASGQEGLLAAMRQWPRHLGLHKRGALVLRNLAVRVPECVPALLEQGAEDVLRTDMALTAELHDLAKAALRDMRCDVTLAQPWKGMPGEETMLERGDGVEDRFSQFLDTDEARAAMRAAGFDTSSM